MTVPNTPPHIGAAHASRLRSVLRGLHVAQPDIEASAVISSDGLIVASVLGPGTDGDRYAAMCAALLALSERASKEAQRGELQMVLVQGDQGAMLLVRAPDDQVLAVAASPRANLGMIFNQTRKTAASLPSPGSAAGV
ncbi:roadblock/LC7 domain-containing protein [Lysobacter hankyongensis]|uniref:Roadblock/LC7 domain-containing protein n=1 Tax=Lysobacter hankyongensis TaxID=1176535 RepID=A0ABP9AX64_9GAMM